MTRKDFQAVAAGLAQAHELTCTDTATERRQRHFTWAVTVGCVADQLAALNERFNYETFFVAAGLRNECKGN